MAEKDQEMHTKKVLKKSLSGSFDESMAYDRIHVAQLKKIIAPMVGQQYQNLA